MNVAETLNPSSSAEQKRALLAERLRKAAERGQARDLSFGQQRLWFLDQLDPNTPLYNVAVVARLRGELDEAALEDAFGEIVRRHEALRTRFVVRNHVPQQEIQGDVRFTFSRVDLSLVGSQQDSELDRIVRESVSRPFDLSRDLLIRASLVRLEERLHLLVLVVHHIVSDEWSLKILFDELAELYRARLAGRSAALRPLAIQYADFAASQIRCFSSGGMESQLEYWKRQLSRSPGMTELPTDFSRGPSQTLAGSNASLELGRELTGVLQEFARREGVTVFMVLLAALKVLVARYSRREDVIIGSPIAGRTRVEVEALIGFFVNTLPLRTSLEGNPTFKEFLRRVRETTLDAYGNQDLPFDKIVQALHPQRSLSHMPFTRIMFAFQNRLLERISLGALELEFLPVESSMSKFDLTIVAQESSRGITLRAEYCKGLFSAETIDRLLRQYGTLLQGALENPDTAVQSLGLIDSTERDRVLRWGSPRSFHPDQRCIHEIFEEQAAQYPNATAISFGGDQLSYSELNGMANQLARYLEELGCGPGVRVGLCTDRSADMVVATLAILKAGAVYVPIDPGFPRERIEWILRDTSAAVLLTQEALLAGLPEDIRTVCLDADRDLTARYSRKHASPGLTAEALAYIMYTSGSTGTPKGVAVPHRAVVRLVRNTDYVNLTNEERIAQVSNISFDAATFEIWGALLNGGHLVGFAKDLVVSPAEFARELRAQRISTLFLTTALFNQIASEAPGAFGDLRNLLFGGEAVDPKWVRAVLKNRPPARLLHVYGPTENTTFSTWHLVGDVAEKSSTVPIGRPIAQTQCYVLDASRQLVPVGVPGELYVGGEGLACGYWQRGELTEEKFVQNPFRGETGRNRLYRTGDLVRWSGEGTLEFLGRVDEQVKLRGYRIEPGEIESALDQHEAVSESVVTVQGGNDRRLVAYFVARNGVVPNATQLRRFLAQTLPDYMLPSVFMALKALPLNANGKVDRSALPAPEAGRPELERQYVAPRDTLEMQLAGIWEGVLDVSPVGIYDGFFDLGGHSLLAVQVISRIEKVFGKKLRLATIFQAPTIEQLAGVLREEGRKSEGSASGTSLVEIHRGASRSPLFLVHGAGGGMFWGYANLAAVLGPDQPVYGFKSRGLDGFPELETIEEMAAHYIRDLKRVQPRGPYHLGGYCFGGNVAYEMACQLQAEGESVALLALFNCAPPNSSYGRIPWSIDWGAKLVRNLLYWAGYFRNWTPSQRREFFRWKWSVLKSRISHVNGSNSTALEAGNLVDLSSYTPEQRAIWESHIHALANYHPKPYDGPVHLFRSPGHPLWCSFATDYGWGDLVKGELRVTMVPAVHEKILEEPCINTLGRFVRRLLDGAPETEPPLNVSAGDVTTLKSFALQALLFVLGAEAAVWILQSLSFEEQGLTLSTLFQNLAILGGGVAGSKSLGGGSKAGFKAVQSERRGGRKRIDRAALRVEGVPRLLSPQISQRLRELSRDAGVNLSVTLLAGCRALLARYDRESGSGAPAPQLAIAQVLHAIDLACPINDPVLRTVPGEKSIRDLLAEMRDLWRAKSPAGNNGHDAEQTQEQVTLLNLRLGRGDHGQTETGPEEKSHSDLEIRFEDLGESIMVRLCCTPGAFEEWVVEGLLGSLETVLTSVALEPDMPVSRLPFVGNNERQRVLVEWNTTGAQFELGRCYPHHFEVRAEQTPATVAARMNGQAMTYAELNQRANRLAHHLRNLGVGPEVLVAVCLERSLDLVVCLLAVWKAGGAYVPLDASYPRERLTYMVSDSQPAVLITTQEFLPVFEVANLAVVCLDQPQCRKEIKRCSPENPPVTTEGRHLAYVIYTSGSTGNPKGVQITHSALLNHNFAISGIYELKSDDRVLQFTPISFDISVEEIFPSLLQGCTVVFRSDGDISSPARFLKFVAQENLTVLNVPTAYWHELVDHLSVCPLPSCVRLVVIGGEKASPEAFRRWRERVPRAVKLFNSYGPTETTVTATVCQTSPENPVLTIGRPIANMQALVLDENRQLVPVGLAGELYLAGEGLSRGYLRRSELTAEKFVPNPFKPEISGDRLYRTGDLACFLPDGSIQFLGRVDQQVKIRGFRIELGEIEASLQAHPEVKDAVVVAREDVPGQKRLVAYYVGRSGSGPAVSELLQFLRSKLPAYMVPAAFVRLVELPLTPAGKIDRRGLPKPDNHRPDLDQRFIAPRTPVEEVLARIWCEVLGLESVGICDNFFDLGGHSLLATQLLGRIRDAFKVDINLASLFSLPTIKLLAENLAEASGQAQPALHLADMGEGRKMDLTVSQQRVWFLDQFDPRQSAFNIALGVRLSGRLDQALLEQSLTELARRHEGLRSVFPVEHGRPIQYVYEPRPAAVQVVDLTHLPAGDRAGSAKALATEEARKPYIVSNPMLRPVLFRLSQREHWLVLVLHEIAADVPSVRLVFRELKAIYNELSAGKSGALPETPPTYEEIRAANIGLSETEQATELAFWKDRLADAPSCLHIPSDRPRPAFRSDEGSRVPVRIPADLFRRIDSMAGEMGATRFSFLLAVFKALLHRHTGATDLVAGTRFENRTHPMLACAVGRYSNQVALRTSLAGDPRFLELVQRTRETVAQAQEHGRVPFGLVVDAMQPERDPSHTPLFQVSFVLDEQPLESCRAGEVDFTPFEVSNNTAKLDLALHLEKSEDELTGWFEYNTALFDVDRIERLAQQFETVLQSALTHPQQRLSELQVLPQAEAFRLTYLWNQAARPYDLQPSLGDLFRLQVERTPDAEALVCEGGRFTYAELFARSKCITSMLRARGVGNHTLIGICLERSWEMLACILGTLQAGAAYVPLDPEYPRERIGFTVRDAELGVLITSRRLMDRLPDMPVDIMCVEDVQWNVQMAEPVAGNCQASDLAYVIYTSGSTGNPKGVAIEHRNAVALIHWAAETYTQAELSGVLAATSTSFDLSVFELFAPLCTGGRVILAKNALSLPGLAARDEVTLINTVPSAMRELLRLKAVPPGVKAVNLAGEPLAAELADQIYRETGVEKVYDLYGPTETTTYSTCALRRAGAPATIGRPLPNEQVYVLDPRMNLAPIGVPGEVYIGGVGVARGYLNRPELTAERFVADPFTGQGRLYKTGDLARWRSDGTIEYLGRIDHQVKIRGFRIEPGEIENVLKRHAGAKDCVVVPRISPNGDTSLAAYVVPQSPGMTDVSSLRVVLEKRVPAYMIPSDFVLLEALPLTPNGKVDRKALPVFETRRCKAKVSYVAPRTLIEEHLALVWEEVLGLEQIGVLDDFFDLGGHSLLAVQVVSRVREVFKVELPLFSLFEAPTIGALAEGLAANRWAENQQLVLPLTRRPAGCLLPASYVQERLWFLDQLQPGSDAYNVPAALRIKGPLKTSALVGALNAVLVRHEALRTTLEYHDGEVYQTVSSEQKLDLRIYDLGMYPKDQLEMAAENWVNSEAQRPFDLAKGPLIRAALLKIEERDHVLVVTMHHSISDGWSLTIFFQEVEAYYNALAAGEPAPVLPEPPVQYPDYARWQRQWIQGRQLERELAYWTHKLAGAPTALDLPSDSRPDAAVERKAGNVAALLDLEVSRSLVQLSQREGATPFMVLLAALVITVYKWTGQKDQVLGTVVAGRSRQELERVIGCFMNFLPIRTRLQGQESGREILQKVKSTVLEAQTHGECPFEKMVEALNPERRQDQNPLYNVALLLQNYPNDLFHGHSLQASWMPTRWHAPLLDLRFEAELTAEGFSLVCEYKTDLFEDKTIQELVACFRQTIERLVRSPDEGLSHFAVTPELASRARRARSRDEKHTVAIAANFTAEPVEDTLQYWLQQLEVQAHVEFAPYNQIFQELLDPTSLLASNRRGLNVVCLRLQDWGGVAGPEDSYDSPGEAGAPKPEVCSQRSIDSLCRAAIERNVAEFVSALKTAAARGGAPWLVVFCPPSPEVLNDRDLASFMASQEQIVAGAVDQISGLTVTTSAQLLRAYKVENYADANAETLGHVPYTPVFYTGLATRIARSLHAVLRPPKKVVVLDCDQTLWYGVCGEDGAGGLRIDPPWKALQEFMRARCADGMLLCLCSKNNEEDVHEVFARRADMPLAREHFAAMRLNWLPKSENIKSLAQELQLGLESFIFVDDNPVECADVEANCPGVLVLQLPDDPRQIPGFLDHCWAFDQFKVTEEDRKRTEMYRQNHEREQLRAESRSLADFIAGLDLRIGIHPLVTAQLARVAQLTQRTNQFNFTTRRRTESELQQLWGQTPTGSGLEPAEILTVTVKDRFGDYGLVGVMIYRFTEKALDVDTFLLSCRVLGRGVEHRMLAKLGEIARVRGLAYVNAHFVGTAKNKPALDFLENTGAVFKQALNGGFIYRFPTDFAIEVAYMPQAGRESPEDESGRKKGLSAIPAQAAEGQGNHSAVVNDRVFAERCRSIAIESGDPERIHLAVESAAVSRNHGRRSVYVEPHTDLERRLCELWQKVLHAPKVGIRDNFFDLGGHSLLAVRLFAEIERITGRKFPLVTLFQAPTVEQLGQVLSQRSAPDNSSLLVPIQPHGSKPPLILVHGAGGDVLWGYANLAAQLGADQPLYGIKSRGQVGLEELTSIEEMARCYLEAVRHFQPHGPYYLGGYCFGGNVAYEMARQLRRDGEEVALVALLDSSPSNAGYEDIPWWNPGFAIRFARNLGSWLKDFAALKPVDRRNFFLRKARAFGRKLVARIRGIKDSEHVDLEEVIDLTHFPDNELRLWQIHLQALVQHVEQPYEGRVTLLRTRGQPLFCSLAEDFCWGKLACGGVEVRLLPGSHENVFVEPHVRDLARELGACMTDALSRTASSATESVLVSQ